MFISKMTSDSFLIYHLSLEQIYLSLKLLELPLLLLDLSTNKNRQTLTTLS